MQPMGQLNASFFGYHAAGVAGAGTEIGSTIDAEGDGESGLDVKVEADAGAGGESGADINADAKVKVPTSESGWTRSEAELNKVSVISWFLRLLGCSAEDPKKLPGCDIHMMAKSETRKLILP
jgi:hypothetical protein